MKKITIEIFNLKTDSLVDSVSIPATLLSSFSELFQGKLSAHFNENGDKLDLLVESAKNPNYSGVLLKIEENDERVVISID
ncbi:hypothetical protein [Pelagibaculum spongiae]|uniref:Uncharacterized protein n=1 Tax=Pelagibaculum spongiae TaxID=2080658 RepID=A0A2V1GZN0_9GAMM|nr:hypothetical protein [Pelagibaculum spongiae]PVZ72186.1 hypothetical protein DC094_03995 [Pelagibaculum spongiae]